MKKHILFISLFSLIASGVFSQLPVINATPALVDFSDQLREWDGFGFNYVELAHTYDYDEFRQEYGGFSLLDEKEKQEIIELVFGEDGLKVGLVKMFLDAIQQEEKGGEYDHSTTTENMRYFVKEGLKKTRERGDDLSVITTLYGPPAYMNLQKTKRGRDLDPGCKEDLAMYMVDWVHYLKNEEGIPVKYLSLHNEGEDWSRWNNEGYTVDWNHDYNLFWTPELVNEYLRIMPGYLRKAGLEDVGMTNGETSNWYRFSTWGYSHHIAQDPEALENLALITSHGFYSGNYGRWFGEHKSTGIDELRELKPDLHAWVTSTSWSNMDAFNIKEMHGNIYTAKVNAIIPWAGIQRPPHWVGGDPNPGSAISVSEDGTYEVRRGYYFYKQITRAGQPGMAVAYTEAMNSDLAVIAFASNGTKNPDAFVIVNLSRWDQDIDMEIRGTDAKTFTAFRTTAKVDRFPDREEEYYVPAGEFKLKDAKLILRVPAGSVTTFFAD